MSPELLEIQPRELKFTFELKKQSSCSVQLVNNSDLYVAFKVKTTSPKRYCVRPNIGIVEPNSHCDFTVTMQAQRAAPPDMQFKDKFLIQSTIVPFGTAAEDITSSMFAKDNGKYVEENKMRVILVSPPHSPVLLPMNGALKQESAYETPMNGAPVLLPTNGALKQEPVYEAPTLKDQVLSGVENHPPPNMVAKDVEELKLSKDVDELKLAKDVEKLKLAKDVEELKMARDVEELKLVRDFEELKSKLNELESKLSEAEITITRLTEEKSTAIQERKKLHQEVAMLRRTSDERKVQVGFPFLFVCLVALVGLVLGYLLRS